MIEIIPGILEKEWEAIERKLTLAKAFSKSVHIDILDGKFAPNTTWLDPAPFAKYKDDFLLEVHMMVDDPAAIVTSWADAGFRRFIGQVEKMPDQRAFLEIARPYGEAGLAFDSPTSIDDLEAPLDEVDFLFVMTVKAGFSNQSFLSDMLEKVRAFRTLSDLPIEIDGGVNDKTIADGLKAGATRFVSTGFLFNAGKSPEAQYQVLLSSCGASVGEMR